MKLAIIDQIKQKTKFFQTSVQPTMPFQSVTVSKCRKEYRLNHMAEGKIVSNKMKPLSALHEEPLQIIIIK